MKVIRKIIEIDEERCDGCGNCVVSCAEGAIKIIDGKAKVVKDSFCDGLGACMGDCPQDALKLIEREADEFDEEAVEVHLKNLADQAKEPTVAEETCAAEETMACGCSSTHIQTFPTDNQTSCQKANEPTKISSASSQLRHWPVQIRLVPPKAPFLKDADLLITADCVPIAYGAFHEDFIKGRVVLMGCPKFDDQDAYVEKFADIFKTAPIKSITALIMEVPCCAGLPGMIKAGMKEAGVTIPFKNIVISPRGEILSEMDA